LKRRGGWRCWSAAERPGTKRRRGGLAVVGEVATGWKRVEEVGSTRAGAARCSGLPPTGRRGRRASGTATSPPRTNKGSCWETHTQRRTEKE